MEKVNLKKWKTLMENYGYVSAPSKFYSRDSKFITLLFYRKESNGYRFNIYVARSDDKFLIGAFIERIKGRVRVFENIKIVSPLKIYSALRTYVNLLKSKEQKYILKGLKAFAEDKGKNWGKVKSLWNKNRKQSMEDFKNRLVESRLQIYIEKATCI